MVQLAEHPTVKQFHEHRNELRDSQAPSVLDAAWLRQVCLDAGADDVGVVERGRAELADQSRDIDFIFPRTKTLISFVVRMNRGNIRTPARSIANLEFHHTTDETNDVARAHCSCPGSDRRGCDQWRRRRLSDGSGPLGIKDVGDFPQACGRCCRPGAYGYPPQCDSSEIRQLHAPWDSSNGRRGQRTLAPACL